MFARELEERPTRVDGRNGKGPLQFLPRGRRGWRSSPIRRARDIAQTHYERLEREARYPRYERHDLTPANLLRPPLPRRVDERLDVALRRRLEHAMP